MMMHADMVEDQMNNFLQTDFRVGLQETDYSKIKQILKLNE